MRTFLTLSTTLCLLSLCWPARADTKRDHSPHAQRSAPPHGVEHLVAHGSQQAASGGGLIRPQHGSQARSVVDRAYMDIQSPGATAFQLASMLPGANVATSDPFGISPQTNLSVRGLNGDALGYVLEGMPLNDVAYYGGYPSQFADTENYSEVGLQQGSADLNSPVLNAAGGLMSLHFLDPSFKPGGMASFSYGSYNMRRGFLRLETGEIGHTGVRAFASYSNSHTDNWRGAGHDDRQHVDFKFLKEWGQGNRMSLLGSWNRAITSYYPHATLDQWHSSGIHINQAKRYDPNNAAQGTDYWKLWRDPEETFYIGAPMHFRLSHHFSFDLTPYAQSAYGNFPSGSTLGTTGNYLGTQPVNETLNLPGTQNGTAPIRWDSNQRSYRSGFNAALHARYGWNDIVLGYWYDYTDDNEQQPFTTVQSNGYSGNIWADKSRDRVLLQDGQRLLAGSFHTMSQVNALFLGDHISLFKDRLTFDIGFKEVMLSRWGTNALPGPQHNVTSNSAEPLPRFGMRWSITPRDQLFLNATTNFRAPAVTAYYDTFALTSPDRAGVGTSSLKNEYSISEEIGYRRTGEWITGSVTFFNYNFTNRQVTTQNSTGTMSYSVNAGGQTSRGVDAEIGTRPWHHISPYVSFEYLHATIDNNLPSNGDVLPTKGKTAVRSPHVQAAVGLRYDDGRLFGMITAHYTGKQYATFMNDERMPSYTTADLSMGYRFSNVSILNKPTMRLNFLNITNQHYLSGVSSTQFNAHTTRGIHGSSIAGTSPSYYIGGGFAVLFTASTGF